MKEYANTGRQLQVLGALLPRDGLAPTFEEIGVRVGLKSLNAVARHIRILERRGLIAKEQRKRRSIKVLEAGLAALERNSGSQCAPCLNSTTRSPKYENPPLKGGFD